MDKRKKGEKLLASTLPKIADYYMENENLTKDNLDNFLEQIGLIDKINNDKMKNELWTILSKKTDKIKRVSAIEGLSKYIDTHINELFPSIQHSIKDYISTFNPKLLLQDLNDINEDNLYEYYKCLALIECKYNQNININKINDYPFIQISNEDVIDITKKITQIENIEKSKNIDFNLYYHIMNKLKQKFVYKISEIHQKVFVFNEEYLNDVQIPEFEYIEVYMGIIFNIKNKIEELSNELNNDELSNEDSQDLLDDFNKKYIQILMENINIFGMEVLTIYIKQKQKYEYYNPKILSKINDLTTTNEILEKQNDNTNTESARNYANKIYSELCTLKEINKSLNNKINQNKIDLRNNENDIIVKNDKIDTLENELNELKLENQKLNKDKLELTDKLKKMEDDLNDNIIKTLKNNQNQNINNTILNKMNLTEHEKELISLYHTELVNYIQEKDKLLKDKDNIINQTKNELKKLTATNKKLEDKINDLQNNNNLLIKKYNDLEKDNELLNNDLNQSRMNNSIALDSLLFQDDQNKGLQIVNPINIIYQTKPHKKAEKNIIKKKVNFDYLFIKSDPLITVSLDDEYYNSNSNLIFTEKVNYLDENKEEIPCILFITENYLYLFNNETHEKCFSIKISELLTVNASTINNIISMSFLSGDIIIFELFRVLEFISFLKSLNIYQKINKYNINVSEYNNLFFEDYNNKTSYTIIPYFGKCVLSGYVKKKRTGNFILNKVRDDFSDKFIILSDVGLIIMESLTKPQDIINLLFAKIDFFEDDENRAYLDISVGDKKYVFLYNNVYAREVWLREIENWILGTYNSDSFYI